MSGDPEFSKEELAADEEYMDHADEDFTPAPSPKAAGSPKSGLAAMTEKADEDVRRALDKVLTVAQKMSDFYSASEAISGPSGARVPKGFTGTLYGYQKRVGVQRVWGPVLLPSGSCVRSPCRVWIGW
jgi:hypothetical protein